MNLDKVLNIWNDLEKSFQLMKSSLGVDNREDFLKKIVGYNGEKTLLLDLKLELSNDESKYNSRQLQEYTELCKLFDLLDSRISQVKTISNLNVFIERIKENKVINMTSSDLNHILNRKLSSSNLTTNNFLYSNFKALGNVTTFNGSLIKYESSDIPRTVYFKSKNDVESKLKVYSSLSEFEKKCVYFMVQILKEYNPTTYFIDGDIEYCRLGKRGIKMSEVKERNGLKFRECSINSILGKGSVIAFV